MQFDCGENILLEPNNKLQHFRKVITSCKTGLRAGFYAPKMISLWILDTQTVWLFSTETIK